MNTPIISEDIFAEWDRLTREMEQTANDICYCLNNRYLLPYIREARVRELERKYDEMHRRLVELIGEMK